MRRTHEEAVAKSIHYGDLGYEANMLDPDGHWAKRCHQAMVAAENVQRLIEETEEALGITMFNLDFTDLSKLIRSWNKQH